MLIIPSNSPFRIQSNFFVQTPNKIGKNYLININQTTNFAKSIHGFLPSITINLSISIPYRSYGFRSLFLMLQQSCCFEINEWYNVVPSIQNRQSFNFSVTWQIPENKTGWGSSCWENKCIEYEKNSLKSIYYFKKIWTFFEFYVD